MDPAVLTAPPQADSAEAWRGTIALSVRWYFRGDLPRLWAERRRWFLYGHYRWKALDMALDFDITRYCREA